MTSYTFRFPDGVPASVHIHLDGTPVLDAVRALTETLNQIGTRMALDMTALIDAVTAIETVGAGVVEVLARIVAQLEELIASSGNTVDPAEIQSLVDRLNAERDAIAAAVADVPPATPPTP